LVIGKTTCSMVRFRTSVVHWMTSPMKPTSSLPFRRISARLLIGIQLSINGFSLAITAPTIGEDLRAPANCLDNLFSRVYVYTIVYQYDMYMIIYEGISLCTYRTLYVYRYIDIGIVFLGSPKLKNILIAPNHPASIPHHKYTINSPMVYPDSNLFTEKLSYLIPWFVSFIPMLSHVIRASRCLNLLLCRHGCEHSHHARLHRCVFCGNDRFWEVSPVIL
jgi:hypothetical protein